MSTSIPISELAFTPRITKEDYIAIVDSSSLTTYKETVGTLNSFAELSGSFLSTSYTSHSVSTSYTINTSTASYMYPETYLMTASWTENVPWGNVVGTSSLSYNALTASRLEGIGSSYETHFIVYGNLSTTSSAYIELATRGLTSSANIPSIKSQAFFFNKDYVSGTSDYGKIFFFDDTNYNKAKMVFEVGDEFADLDNTTASVDRRSYFGKGFRFQTSEAGNLNGQNRTGSLLFISSSGRTYGRFIEAQEFTSSYYNQSKVGFYGTVSYAANASYSIATAQTFPTGTIVGFAGTPTIPTWNYANGTEYNPIAYPNLSSSFGTSFGLPMSFSFVSVSRKTSGFGTAAKFKITGSSGSGVFVQHWDSNATTYYLNNYVGYTSQVTGLSAGNYTFQLYDIGFNPPITLSLVAKINANNTADSRSAFITGSDTYRYPNMGEYFVTYADLNPFTWIIQTG